MRNNNVTFSGLVTEHISKLATKYKTLNIPLINTLLVFGSVLYISICAQISVPLWFTPVPLTLQTFAIFSTAIALGKWRGMIAATLYTICGLVGLPVFANGTSGLKASLGYVLGFIVASFVVGTLAEKGFDKTLLKGTALVLISNTIVYLSGVVFLMYYMHITSLSKAFTLGVAPFLIVELLKSVVLAVALPSAWKISAKVSDKINSKTSSTK